MGIHHGQTTNLQVDYHDHFLSIKGYENMPLVSLEIAVEPLMTLLPSIQTYIHLAKEKCRNPADGLTCDQSAAIMLCTMRWQPVDQCLSYVLNTILRSTDREKLKRWFLYLKLLLTGLRHLPSIHRTVYRGIQLDLSEQYPKDKTIIWWDFSLCTNSLDKLYSEKYLNKNKVRTIFTIECHSSKDISKHSFYPSTDMILLLAATQFRVIQCVKQETNLYWIQLKEIESPLNHSQAVSTVPQLPRDFTGINSTSFSIPSSCIKQYPSYSPIQLRFKQISNREMIMLVRQAIEKQCTELWLCNSQITSQGALIISNGLFHNSTLIKLYLNDNCIYDRGVYVLSRILSSSNSTLKELYLARNGITSQGAHYLADMLNTNQTLITLCLYGNQINDEGMKYLTHVLTYYNKSLEYLYLSGNKFMTDLSVDYFIQMFEQNQTLKKLHLFNCNLSKIGQTKLREAIRTKTNFILHI